MKRTIRLNSLLKEVISEVMQKELVHNPNISPLTSVIKVDVAPDLHQAKIYISIIGTQKEKEQTLKALQKAAGYISSRASKQVSMHYFPSLTFLLDTQAEDFFKIDTILDTIKEEQKTRQKSDED